MKYEHEQCCIFERQRESKHTCLSTVLSHIIREGAGGCSWTHHGLIITNDLHIFFCPEGERNTEKQSLSRIREETQHYRSTLQPHYQTQFALFTMPECPMAKADFFFFTLMGINPKQINFPRAPDSVAMDIQCGCMFWDQSDDVEARANQRHGI